MSRILAWLERKNFVSVHAMTLYVTIWMSWQAFEKMSAYALVSRLDGIGTAAVIAAVTAPITALQVFVFRTYSESRKP